MTKDKIFVLDTSVILHDHKALLSFEEHDVAIPITTLEEVDTFKKGGGDKNFAARQFIRTLDQLTKGKKLQNWISLGEGLGQFKIILHANKLQEDAKHIFDSNTNDNKILNAALSIKNKETPARVILVSKDINLRLKAKSLDLEAEDYETGKINTQELYSGIKIIENVDEEILKIIYKQGATEKVDFLQEHLKNNHYYLLKNGKTSILTYFNPITKNLERVEKSYTYGVKPRNYEQTFALHAILNPNIKLVTIQGVAGTGKTLLALAGALEQKNRFDQIILARPIVPLSNKDIGYLPGDASEKINPYMEPLWDNLKFIKGQFNETEKKNVAIDEMLKEGKILITPLAFIRGRSFSKMIFIVDEAQNLSPHEIKTIITRAGEDTKIIFTGDIKQIDTPYLDEQSNGLSYVIDRMKGQELYAHVTLEKGERSELANLANELL